MRSKSNGFTLIELLIAIAIIGVLSTSLIPNLMSARERAIDTTAKTYLRDAMTMQEIYSIDNGSYAAFDSDLTSIGLKALPSNLDFEVIALGPSESGYCMTIKQKDKSNATVFHATSNSSYKIQK